MKLKVFSIEELDNLLKGIIKAVDGCCMEINNKGAVINIGNGKIRAFLKTTCIATENSDDTVELCFEQLNTLIQALLLLKDSGITGEVEFETDGVFLSYKGRVKFKLKLDKKERVMQFVTVPLKTEFKELFSFKITQETISFLLKYSTFNNSSFVVKAYFYIKDGILYADIDDKTQARLSVVSLPITEKFDGELTKPFILDLNDINMFSLIDKKNIKVILTDYCIKVLSFRKTDTDIKTAMQLIVPLLKN